MNSSIIKIKGYTLIEVIIALAIFAILGALSVGLLSRAFETKARLAHQVGPISEVQLTASRITQDAAQMVNRPVRDSDMKKIDAFAATTARIEFTRGGFIEPLEQKKQNKKSTLRRIALSCEDNTLVRYTWPILDGFDDSTPQKQILLDNLTDCHFAFAAAHHTWSDQWRAGETNLPPAFKLYLNLKNLGETALIFSIPAGKHIDD